VRFVGTDIGGTFTDLVGYDSNSGELVFGKTLTDYGDFVAGVTQCLVEVGLDPGPIDVLKHGTTQIINTLIERQGARTALVTTEGFRDILEIGRASRPIPFDLDYARNPPLVPRHLRFEIKERMDAKGTVLIAPDPAEIEVLASSLEELKVEAVAVAFINAYRNPTHEIFVAEFFRRRLQDVYVTTGAELSREWFEFERSATAAANAYVGPRAKSYIDRFASALGKADFRGKFLFMGSNGGVLSSSRAQKQPIALVESGPIGGCIGAAAYARRLGKDKLIAFDMGGTTAKCALIERAAFDVQGTYRVGGYEYGFPILTPVLDIVEVGTGGGSIASVDQHGRLRVGPRSAGSTPGPAAFNRGGVEPTVTDANLVLGRIGGETFLNGALPLDERLARAALIERIAHPLGYEGLDIARAVANGIISFADAQMAMAIKEITIDRGKDVRDFELFVFGGGGPLHAANLARELNISRVIVPPEPGNFSALGMLLADARVDEAATFLLDLSESGLPVLREQLTELRKAVTTTLSRDFAGAALSSQCHLEMRYKGQRHSIRVGITGTENEQALRALFFAAYQARYGRADQLGGIELVGAHVVGFAQTDQPDLARLHRASGEVTRPLRRNRNLWFPDQEVACSAPIYVRSHLPIGREIEGPAIIEEFGSTTVIGPGDHLRIGEFGEFHISILRRVISCTA
jgi:N-methylhydantoinase A